MAVNEQHAAEQQAVTPHGSLLVSVVVPVFNGGEDFDRCLGAVYRSDWPTFECIVVDDASTDQKSAEISLLHGARLERMEQRGGPALARNAGVAKARGEIVFFTDADVLLREDALRQAVTAFQSDPGIAAVFGSYDDTPGDSSLISRYRNLYHHWNHQVGNAEASTFWTGCGAVRKDAFIGIGGFSSEYSKPSIEDIELGYRLREAGYRIRLRKTMLCTHLKRWTFRNMVRTDIFRRAVPWVVLLQRHRSAPADLNLNIRARIATVAAALLAFALLLMPFVGHARATFPILALVLAAALCSRLTRNPTAKRSGKGWKSPLAVLLGTLLPLLALLAFPDPLALLPLLLVAVIVWAQIGFYRLLSARGGAGFAIAAVPLQTVFFIGCALAVPLGYLQYFCRHGLPGRKNRD
jgi:GT2 family glycosyltransferase